MTAILLKALDQQPWLKNGRMDFAFILLPLVLPVIIIIAFQNYFAAHTEVTSFWWILLVLNIDVAHVYSTLFRFYWDKSTYEQNKRLLVIIPVAAFCVGAALHLAGAMTFWRVIAYLAVFHFVRQQYGFMRLYARKEPYDKTKAIIDSLSIYNATLYPVLYWHFYLTDQLHWFVEGDFVSIPNALAFLFKYAYWAIIIFYVFHEAAYSIRRQKLNIPKNALMLGTYLSWYLGIITFNGDLVFTMLNVAAHGIPYMALVYFYSHKRLPNPGLPWKGIATFVTTILVLAYVEEGLWDGMIWRDHEAVFPLFASLPMISNSIFLSFLVPLLALPQITHYVLDGFIWKISRSNNPLRV